MIRCNRWIIKSLILVIQNTCFSCPLCLILNVFSTIKIVISCVGRVLLILHYHASTEFIVSLSIFHYFMQCFLLFREHSTIQFIPVQQINIEIDAAFSLCICFWFDWYYKYCYLLLISSLFSGVTCLLLIWPMWKTWSKN